MKKRILLPVAALTLAGVLAYGTARVRARDYGSYPWHQQIVEQFAAKFGVGENEVESALNEVHEQLRIENQVQMQSRFEEQLQNLVEAGELTEGQKEAWIDKHEEWQAEREAQRTAHHDEMQSWFAEQGIDPTVLGPMGMGKGMGGRGYGMHQ